LIYERQPTETDSGLPDLFRAGHRFGPAHSISHPIINEKGADSMKLNKNMGTLDRTLRIMIAVVIAALYFNGNLSGMIAIILGILAVIFVLTSTVSFYPLYLPFGFSTCKK
jgi:hypothetical protein